MLRGTRVNLPFQVIETVNESRATREVQKTKSVGLFEVYEGREGETFEAGWRNKLIWGDNLLVMGSLLEKFAGKIDLIYIDPPFDTGSDFSYRTMVGGDDDPMPGKEPSIIEEKTYRDTWGGGYDSYLHMMRDRLILLYDLLADTGSIFVHLDAHTGPYIKCLMDELFGQENFQNEIVWYYYNKMHDSRKRLLPKAFDQILYYVKSKAANSYIYNPLTEKREETVRQLKRVKINGKMVNARDDDGKIMYQEKDSRTVDNVWRIRCLQPANKSEYTHFQTQKPVDLIERIINIAGRPGLLFMDAFTGSGSSLVAAERQGMRWIGIDLSRWSIHLTRKRLLDETGCRPFEVLNLGKYERQYWQGVTFAKNGKTVTEQALYEYLAFILKLYGGQPVAGMSHVHGKKGRAMIHIGAVDAPVTISEIDASVEECVSLKQEELHVLGWEWEMGLYDLMVEAAKKKGVKLLLLQIPREVMEQQAAAKGDIRFFELAYLEVKIDKPKKLTVQVGLKDFVIPNTELIPEEVHDKVKKWLDYIDYWAVDWDFRNDTFMQGWVAYRTRKERKLPISSDPHTYESPGKYRILVKVIDIFGNDTSQAFDVEVR
jgi:DNA modification methylase